MKKLLLCILAFPFAALSGPGEADDIQHSQPPRPDNPLRTIADSPARFPDTSWQAGEQARTHVDSASRCSEPAQKRRKTQKDLRDS